MYSDFHINHKLIMMSLRLYLSILTAERKCTCTYAQQCIKNTILDSNIQVDCFRWDLQSYTNKALLFMAVVVFISFYELT